MIVLYNSKMHCNRGGTEKALEMISFNNATIQAHYPNTIESRLVGLPQSLLRSSELIIKTVFARGIVSKKSEKQFKKSGEMDLKPQCLEKARTGRDYSEWLADPLVGLLTKL